MALLQRYFLHADDAGNTVCLVGWLNRYMHYNDVIMGAMATQITSLTIVCSTVYSKRRSKKTSKLCVTGLSAGNSPVTGEFPEQKTSNAENVSIWWRHHVYAGTMTPRPWRGNTVCPKFLFYTTERGPIPYPQKADIHPVVFVQEVVHFPQCFSDLVGYAWIGNIAVPQRLQKQ